MPLAMFCFKFAFLNLLGFEQFKFCGQVSLVVLENLKYVISGEAVVRNEGKLNLYVDFVKIMTPVTAQGNLLTEQSSDIFNSESID